MSLNVLLSHTPVEVKDLLNRSFASHQGLRRGSPFQTRWDELRAELERLLPAGKCDTSDPVEVMENILQWCQLRRRAKRLAREAREDRKLRAFEGHLKPGALLVHKNRQVYVVFRVFIDKGRRVCLAHNLRRTLRKKGGEWRLKRVDVRLIRSILAFKVELNEEDPPEKIRSLLSSIPLEGLKEQRIQALGREEEERGNEAQTLPCGECAHLSLCNGSGKGELQSLLSAFRILIDQMAGVGEGLWLSFKRHVRFLKETGFVDAQDRLTQDGLWASKLRLDHPLLIAETIRKGAFSGVSPEIVAGCLAPFVWDRAVEMDFGIDSPLDLGEVEPVFRRTMDSIEALRDLQVRRGFSGPRIFFWPCAAVFLWASALPWKSLLRAIPVDEGDLTSLIARTADHLRQMTNLSETHPDLSAVAARAIDLIMREPVYIE